jgi:hypothetical protein
LVEEEESEQEGGQGNKARFMVEENKALKNLDLPACWRGGAKITQGYSVIYPREMAGTLLRRLML